MIELSDRNRLGWGSDSFGCCRRSDVSEGAGELEADAVESVPESDLVGEETTGVVTTGVELLNDAKSSKMLGSAINCGRGNNAALGLANKAARAAGELRTDPGDDADDDEGGALRGEGKQPLRWNPTGLTDGGDWTTTTCGGGGCCCLPIIMLLLLLLVVVGLTSF